MVDSSDSYGADPFDCLGMDVADARRLDAALREAGFERDAWIYHRVLDRPEAVSVALGVAGFRPELGSNQVRLPVPPGRDPVDVALRALAALAQAG